MIRSVTIVGAGPAGLTAARVLRRAGFTDVLVLERNPIAGGLPRFCAHHGWGMLDFGHFWTGPDYARALVRHAGAEIVTDATVLGLEPGGGLRVAFPDAVRVIHSRAVLLATGVRETPRSARLISGTRPWGVTTTGAFQEMVTAGRQRPFQRPVIIGTELVAFSALLTAREAGITPVAMIEAGPRITARRPGDLVARVVFGVPLHLRTRLIAIEGGERVEGVVVEHDGERRTIPCDGVVLTGGFVPETGVLRGGVIAIDPATGGPAIDNHHRCSDPAFFAAGNLLRGVEHSGFVAAEGRRAARAIVRALAGGLPVPELAAPVQLGAGLRYVYPQRIVALGGGRITFHARAEGPWKGRLQLLADDRIVADRAVDAGPERRLSLVLRAETLRDCRSLRATLV
jgi:thioredoxin reductase